MLVGKFVRNAFVMNKREMLLKMYLFKNAVSLHEIIQQLSSRSYIV